MRLEGLARRFYGLDGGDHAGFDALWAEVSSCLDRAKAHFSKAFEREYSRNHAFHDVFVTDIRIVGRRSKPALLLDVYSDICDVHGKCMEYHATIIFSGLSALRFSGDMITPNGRWSCVKENGYPFAEILDMWFDYDEDFDCCVLLDEDRFISLKAKNVTFRKQTKKLL